LPVTFECFLFEGIAGNHWNGWSKGTNRRTGQNGLFPSYLVREKWRIVDFALFEN
jgi:glycoprotein 6-alpha-L-fucosyltransferase